MNPAVLPFVAALVVAPVGFEVDFDALPAPKTTSGYEYAITIGIAGHQDFKVETKIGPTGGPFNAALAFDFSDDPIWKQKREGNRITLFSAEGYRITRITVTGDGPKPVVRPVWPNPPEKKK
jgi:hypothetical protein